MAVGHGTRAPRLPLPSALRSARLPVNLIGSPINYANRLIGSPITSQSTAPACRLRHVPLVSRCFSEACQDPHVWPELHVLHSQFSTEARWRSFLRWLAARASGLQTLVFGKKVRPPRGWR